MHNIFSSSLNLLISQKFYCEDAPPLCEPDLRIIEADYRTTLSLRLADSEFSVRVEDLKKITVIPQIPKSSIFHG